MPAELRKKSISNPTVPLVRPVHQQAVRGREAEGFVIRVGRFIWSCMTLGKSLNFPSSPVMY